MHRRRMSAVVESHMRTQRSPGASVYCLRRRRGNQAESPGSSYPFSLLSSLPSPYHHVRATPFASAKRELAKL